MSDQSANFTDAERFWIHAGPLRGASSRPPFALILLFRKGETILVDARSVKRAREAVGRRHG